MMQNSTHFIFILTLLSVFTLNTTAQTSNEYCEITSAQTNYEWIEAVKLETIKNESGNDEGYGDYTSLSTDLTKGKTYDLSLTPGFNGQPYGEHWSVFIDWNGDGDFYDPKEKINTGVGTVLETATVTFKVPMMAKVGATRMRVMMHYDGMNINACKQFSWGEVEDYSVNVVAGDGVEDEDPEPVENDGYCVVDGGKTKYEWIEKVILGDFENMSGNDGGYGNYTEKEITVAQGAAYELILQPGFKGMVYGEHWSVYMDFNGNGSFSDDGERVVHNYFPKVGKIEKSVVIPMDAVLGAIGMRVMMHYGDFIPNACAELGWGEVEDYTLTVIENDGSQPPVIIDSTEVTNPDQPEVEGDLYCEMYGKNSAYEWIESVEIGTISNVSGNDGGYGDYTNLVTKIEQGEAHEIKLTPAFSGGNYAENWSVFIDWNGDGEFKDGELVFKTAQPTSQAFRAALEVPVDATLGDTRMRISMRYKKSNYHGCGKFDWGEVEDYTVKVVESDGIDNGVEVDLLGDPEEDPEISFPDPLDELDSLVFNEDILDNLDLPMDGWNDPELLMNLFAAFFPDFDDWEEEEAIADLIMTFFPAYDFEENPEIVNMLMDIFAFDPYFPDFPDFPDFPEDEFDDFATLDSLLNLLDPADLDNPELVDSIINAFFDNLNEEIEDNWQNWLDSIDFVEGYCEMVGTNSGYEWIEQVSIETLNNISGKDDGYGNYSDMVVELTQGNEYTLTLTPGFKNLAYPEYWNVFIDFNQDGTFDNEEEWVYVGFNPTKEVVEVPISIPYSVAQGTTLMRVAMQYDFDFMFQPCGEFSFGEVEDYTIQILENEGVDENNPNGAVNPNATQEYCLGAYGATNLEWIKKVSIGNIDNESGSDVGYGDYTSLSTDIIMGETYDLYMEPDFANGYDLPEYWSVFIDFNADGDFEDFGEQVYDSFTPISGGITIPISLAASNPNIALGDTRMRIMMRFDARFTDACEQADWGEIEDYTLHIVEGAGKTQAVALSNEAGMSSDKALTVNTYPNPATTWLNAQFELTEATTANFILQDITGKTVATYKEQADNGNNNIRLNLPDLATGYYTLRLIANDKVSTQKVLIHKNK